MAENDETPFRVDLPPTLHPAVIKGEGAGPTQARAIMSQLYLTQGKLIDLKSKTESKGPKAPGQAPTVAQIPAGQAAGAATPVVERALNRADQTIANLGTQIETLDKQITAALMAGKSDPASMSEIRAYWLNQGSGKESTFLKVGKLFQDAQNNLSTVSSLLSAPGYLSGIDDPKHLASLAAVASQALVPEIVQDVAETRAALQLLSKAAGRFMSETGTLIAGMADRSADLISATLK